MKNNEIDCFIMYILAFLLRIIVQLACNIFHTNKALRHFYIRYSISLISSLYTIDFIHSIFLCQYGLLNADLKNPDFMVDTHIKSLFRVLSRRFIVVYLVVSHYLHIVFVHSIVHFYFFGLVG